MMNDGRCIVGVAKLKNGPKMVELDGAFFAVAIAVVVTSTVEKSGHFDRVTVVAVNCARGWSDHHVTDQHG